LLLLEEIERHGSGVVGAQEAAPLVVVAERDDRPKRPNQSRAGATHRVHNDIETHIHILVPKC
jgi:hypothetical protein